MKMRTIFLLIFTILLLLECDQIQAWRRRRRRASCDKTPCSWSWSSCSKTCGNGTRSATITRRQGSCGACNPPKSETCNVQICPDFATTTQEVMTTTSIALVYDVTQPMTTTQQTAMTGEETRVVGGSVENITDFYGCLEKDGKCFDARMGEGGIEYISRFIFEHKTAFFTIIGFLVINFIGILVYCCWVIRKKRKNYSIQDGDSSNQDQVDVSTNVVAEGIMDYWGRHQYEEIQITAVAPTDGAYIDLNPENSETNSQENQYEAANTPNPYLDVVIEENQYDETLVRNSTNSSVIPKDGAYIPLGAGNSENTAVVSQENQYDATPARNSTSASDNDEESQYLDADADGSVISETSKKDQHEAVSSTNSVGAEESQCDRTRVLDSTSVYAKSDETLCMDVPIDGSVNTEVVSQENKFEAIQDLDLTDVNKDDKISPNLDVGEKENPYEVVQQVNSMSFHQSKDENLDLSAEAEENPYEEQQKDSGNVNDEENEYLDIEDDENPYEEIQHVGSSNVNEESPCSDVEGEENRYESIQAKVAMNISAVSEKNL